MTVKTLFNLSFTLIDRALRAVGNLLNFFPLPVSLAQLLVLLPLPRTLARAVVDLGAILREELTPTVELVDALVRPPTMLVTHRAANVKLFVCKQFPPSQDSTHTFIRSFHCSSKFLLY